MHKAAAKEICDGLNSGDMSQLSKKPRRRMVDKCHIETCQKSFKEEFFLTMELILQDTH
jgi:hypothetical protein